MRREGVVCLSLGPPVFPRDLLLRTKYLVFAAIFSRRPAALLYGPYMRLKKRPLSRPKLTLRAIFPGNL